MNVTEAAEILNIQPAADHAVVKAAWHALAKRHHPDQGGDTATMQRINEAHDYMSTRTQAARLAEWERLQPKPAPRPDAPMGASGSLDELHRRLEEAHLARKAAAKAASSSQNPTPPPSGSTTRPWKPTPTRRERFSTWKSCQPWPVRWLLSLGIFLLILTGRLAVVAGMFYGYAESVRWGIKALAHGAWVLLIFFPGIPVALAGLYLTAILSGNFLLGGWKGLGDYLTDRCHKGLTPDPNAWTRKNTSTGGRTRRL
ncbi:J domain-containing protein [Acidithiobacillus ferrooxidans]|uniref:J domain-containing protein n=1 Tax=Acidithiobacillus ferrooxidans TaxID=920 RepID=UPI003D18026E